MRNGILPFVLFVFLRLPSFADIAGLNAYLTTQAEKQQIPGISLAVLKDGEILLARGYGFANLEHQVPAAPQTIYQSGSVGKQFTAAGVMLLVEDGKIGLDDPITKYFPASPEKWEKITVRHLLTHTSGIPDYSAKEINYRKDYMEDELLQVLQQITLEFAPGERWSYSNSGYMLLGFLIHKVEGKFYGDFLHERIFQPLGMNTARIINEADIIPNRAAGYERRDGELKNQAWVAPSLNTTADGSLYLTVQDMAAWEKGLHGGKILSQSGWEQVWSPIRLNNGIPYPYGFGWNLSYQRGYRVIQHGGHWQGFSTAICRYPEFGLAVILLMNGDGVDGLSLAHAIAGFIEPKLLHPQFLKEEPDSESRVLEFKAVVSAIASGKSSTQLTPEVLATAGEGWKKELDENLKNADSIAYRACDIVAGKGIEILRSPVDRFCYYSIALKSRTEFMTVAYTAGGKIADLFSDDDYR